VKLKILVLRFFSIFGTSVTVLDSRI